ncbi:hypothetical protein, partial [Beijerinckia sp. L45]|uniref:hypothetical protein n=1 Tax=Beijerinckia sp. L45 TaxID=1641855 RepID=UPI001AEE20DE
LGSNPASSHLVPIYTAVRDHGCASATVAHDSGPFRLPLDRPTITLIGDDTDTALGPTGFHRPSLRRFLKQCRSAVVVSSCAHLKPYATAATNAVLLRQHVVLVETRPQFEQEWITFIHAAQRRIAMFVSTIEPMRGVH